MGSESGSIVEAAWWKPEAPATRAFGSASMGDGGWELTLPTGFGDSSSFAGDGEEYLPAVHGIDQRGQLHTLLGVTRTHHSVQIGGHPRPSPERWRVSGYATGAHLASTAESVSEVFVHLSGLLQWAGAPPIDFQHEEGHVSVTSSRTSLGIANLGDKTVELFSDVEWSSNGREVSMRQHAGFRVEFAANEAVTLDDAMRRVALPLHAMLSFLLVSQVAIEPLGVKFSESDAYGRERTGTYLPRLLMPSVPRRVPDRWEMLAAWPIAGLPLGTWLGRWFENYERLRYPISMLLVPHLGRDLYTDSTMLTAFLSAESLHGLLMDGSADHPKVHRQRAMEILAVAPVEHREWLAARLESNSKGLQRRITELVERAGSTGTRVLGELPEFVSLVTKTRRLVAHPTEGRKEHGERFLYLSGALRWVVRHCLLLELGLSEEVATELVTHCDAFKNDMHLLARLRA